MDNQMKKGDKVWVQVEVLEKLGDAVHVCGHADKSWWTHLSDCKPVEPKSVPLRKPNAIFTMQGHTRNGTYGVAKYYGGLWLFESVDGKFKRWCDSQAIELIEGQNSEATVKESLISKNDPVDFESVEQEKHTLDTKKPGWVPQKSDWLTITKPTAGNDLEWVSHSMDKYDGKTFQFEGEFGWDVMDRLWAKGPEGYYFNLAWLKPWKPKEGDWVTITRPEKTHIGLGWSPAMDVYLGKPQQLDTKEFNDAWCLIDDNEPEGYSYYCFDLKWLSPAEAPKAENKNLQPACVSKVDDVVNEARSTVATFNPPKIDNSVRQLNWNDIVQHCDIALDVETQTVVFVDYSRGLKVDDAFFEAKNVGITRLFYRPIGRVPFNA